ncbi:lipocalin family protein, partial [Campylobacter coli]|uniref:lipocalin family protein n=1 Tax=Campylobacter coli TaxID=195 RepID=UPI0025B21DD0
MIELIGDVNLEKSMGTWLEMARKPAFFQKSCVQSTAEYQLDYAGSTPGVNIKNIGV